MRWGGENVSYGPHGGTGPPPPTVTWAGADDGRRAGYGSAWTCGPTASDQALPAVASQLVDQVIAPRSDG
ncbi:hypothetical protein GCM10023238_34790 [Streptomyces heliomycini]